jgi:hypothetical protein
MKKQQLGAVGPLGSAVALLTAGLAFVSADSVLAQGSAAPTSTPAARPAASSQSLAPSTHFLPNRNGRAGMYYQTVWGIDSLRVKWAESGELVRFSWRVIDADRAQVLNDKKIEPALEDPQAGVSLVVPVMEKVGQLRQTTVPEAGRSYWMTFSNAGRQVKPGHRVNVVIGSFRAENLVVE